MSSQDEADIRALFQRLKAAHADRDAGAILACYAPDARLFHLAPPLGTRGQERAELQAWLDSWDEPLEVSDAGMELRLDGDLAVSTGYVRFEGRKKGDDQSLWFRSTSVLERAPGSWRIRHEHASVPLRMDGSGLAATTLGPGA